MKVIFVILKRIVRGISLLFGLSILTFILMRTSPIDPIRATVGFDFAINDEQYKKFEEYWGLDKAPVEQYFIWADHLIHGDLGESRIYRKPVREIVSKTAKASMALMGLSWTLSGIIGFVLGSLAAFKHGKFIDRFIKWISYLQVSLPTFWVGLLFLLIFSVKLKWFPIGTSAPIGVHRVDVTVAERVKHLILPVLTLSILGIANVTMHTRAKMLDVLNSEYVLFAKARGETAWMIFKNHALRNAIVPAITIHFSYFGELFGGSMLAEQVFSYPGLGRTLTEAGLKSDTPLLLAIVLIGAVFVFAGNTIADILNAITDPYLKVKS